LYLKKQSQKETLRRLFSETRVVPGRFTDVTLSADDRPTVAQWLKRPESQANLIKLWIIEQLGEAPVGGVVTTVETETKYEGYIQQQERQIIRLRDSDRRRIPSEFQFAGIPGLSREIQEKLERVRPETLGQAGRIPGITPAAIAVLDVYLSVVRPAVLPIV
jgi:tRNA uridine 5-carboxymethylaminomethyl modification enzyme